MHHPASLWMSLQLDRAKKALGKPVVFSGYPEGTPEYSPRELACRPALYEREHLSRVVSCAFGKPLSELVAVMDARRYTEGPLKTYPLGEATVIGGTIITGSRRIHHSLNVRASIGDVIGSAPVRDEVVVANTMQGLRYFGHWLSDDVSAFEAFRKHPGLTSLPLPSWGDIGTYSGLFDHQWNQQMIIRSRSLTLIRDLGFSERKAQRYRALRDRLRQRFGKGSASGKVVFLRRGPSGDPREIVNSAELEEQLSAAGVSIVTAEGNSREFIGSLLDAAVIITIEGSQDRHALYALRDGGGMLTLLPPDRFYVATHEWVRNLDMHSGMVIGKAADGGFRIEPAEVLQMVDRLLALSENRAAS